MCTTLETDTLESQSEQEHCLSWLQIDFSINVYGHKL